MRAPRTLSVPLVGLLALVGWCGGGCASTEPRVGSDATTGAGLRLGSGGALGGSSGSSSSLGSDTRPISTLEAALGANNGLEMRRLVVADQPTLALAAFAGRGRAAIENEQLRDRLERNGFRLRIVDEAEVDEALDALGQPLTDVRAWHGQAIRWRELARRNVGPGLATVVDGRARAFSSGAIRLLGRAWTIPMEDGLRLAVELLPHFDHVGHGGYRAMMGHESIRGERFEGLALELHLRAGEVLLLTSEPPGRSWAVNDAAPGRPAADVAVDIGDRMPEDHGDDAGEDNGDARRERVVDDAPSSRRVDFGPAAITPMTLGELLLSGDSPPLRTVLVFHVRLPGASPTVDRPSAARSASNRGAREVRR